MTPNRTFHTGSELIETILQEIEGGNIEEAANLYSRCQDDIGYSLIGAIPDDRSTRTAVAKMFYLAKDFEKAALIFEQAEAYDKAALLYEVCEDYANAAEMYGRIEHGEKAAAMYEKAGNYDRAAQLFTEIGDFERAAMNFERAINNFLGGKMYFKLGKYNKAVELLQKVKYGDQEYFEAAGIIGDILANNGYTDMAIRKYASVVKETDLDESTVGIYYDLAMLYVQKGAAENALGLLEKLAAYDPTYKDTAAVLEGLRVTVQTAQPAGAASQGREAGAEVSDLPGESRSEAEEDGDSGVVAVMEGFEFLKDTPLFQELNLQDMKAVFNICQTNLYAPGDVLIEEDKPGHALFIIKEGKVGVERNDEGSTRQLAELEPGAHVGEMSLIDDGPTSATVRALEPTEVFEISREKFIKLMEANDRLHVKVTHSFIRTLNDRLRKTNQELIENRREKKQAMMANLFPDDE